MLKSYGNTPFGSDNRAVCIGCASPLVAGIPHRAGSYADVAKDPGVDICYVGMLHPFHYENAVTALQNGKHVLVEKPSTCNESDTNALVLLVRVPATEQTLDPPSEI